MRYATATVQQLQLIGDRVRVYLQTDLVPALGQFTLARLSESYDPYLRLPFFPSVIAPSGFAVDLAQADPALRLLSPGSEVDLLGPVGQGLPDLPARTRLLLAADSDPALLLPFAAQAIARGGTATLLLANRYPLDALQPEIELRLGGPSGQLPTLLSEYAPNADQVFLNTAPALYPDLYQALTQARTAISTDFARALVQLPMPCGTGTCYACAVKTTRGHKLACVSGPFFSLTELNLG